MEQKSKNYIRMILVLLLFGMSLLAMGLGLATRGFNFYGIVGLMLVPAGVSLLVLGVHFLRKQW
jgi:hypothetical protein